MGRCSIDLSKLEHELTHELWVDLEEGTGKLFLLLTISGRTNFGPPIADLDKFQLEDDDVADHSEIEQLQVVIAVLSLGPKIDRQVRLFWGIWDLKKKKLIFGL